MSSNRLHSHILMPQKSKAYHITRLVYVQTVSKVKPNCTFVEIPGRNYFN